MWEPVEVWEWLEDSAYEGHPMHRYWGVRVERLATRMVPDVCSTRFVPAAYGDAHPVEQDDRRDCARRHYWQSWYAQRPPLETVCPHGLHGPVYPGRVIGGCVGEMQR